MMAAPYRVSIGRRIANAHMRAALWADIAPSRFVLLTVPARRSGKSHPTPVIVLRRAGGRWPVAPYGERAWVKNARAAGLLTLSRGRRRVTMPVEQVRAEEAGPVLKDYLAQTPITRPFFDVAPDAPREDFVREAPRHPVCRLGTPTPASAKRAEPAGGRESHSAECAPPRYHLDAQVAAEVQGCGMGGDWSAARMDVRRFVGGVDVSATRGLDAALLDADGALVETTWFPGVEAFSMWLDAWGPRLAVVAVDAPGGTARSPGGREAERALRRRGISLYSAPCETAGAPSWMQVGWRIYQVLRAQGFP